MTDHLRESAEARMSEIDDRLERGAALFRRAADDSALLGAALLAFHGALERQIDTDLASATELGDQERRLLEAGRLSWVARAKLAKQLGLLDQHQHDLAIEAAKARLAIAHGDECDWTASEVQTFGRMVALVSGRRELVRQIDQRSERAKTTLASPAPELWGAPPFGRRFPLVRTIVTTLFLLTFAAVIWTLYTQLEGPRLLRALGALSAPTAAPIPLSDLPTAMPAAPRARIIGLGGGPGWLHATPSFDSPTRAIKLADGMEVTLREQQQIDANGLRWQLVEAGGYEGWCPEPNISVMSP